MQRTGDTNDASRFCPSKLISVCFSCPRCIFFCSATGRRRTTKRRSYGGDLLRGARSQIHGRRVGGCIITARQIAGAVQRGAVGAVVSVVVVITAIIVVI